MLKYFQILGCSGGIPTQNRGVTCLMVSTTQFDIMVDCGEGSYLRWQKAGYHWKNLKYILFTHMYPDHTGGLLPLIFYRKIYGISTPLTLIGPPNLEAYLLDSFQHTGVKNNQDIKIINISENMEIQLSESIRINSLEMEHKIPCWGYAFKDRKHKLVFITDTRRNTNTVKLAKKADILIHEATYKNQHKGKAQKHFHTTEIQAMEIADEARVKRLILTHFSQRLSDEDVIKWTWQGQPCVVFDERQKI